MTDTSATTTYTATYTHDGRNWVAQFADVEISTYGRTIAAAKEAAREALAVYLDFDSVDALVAAGITVDDRVVVPKLPPELAEARAAVEAANRALADVTAAVAANLSAQFSTRDIGELVGLSHQRVAQMLRESAATWSQSLDGIKHMQARISSSAASPQAMAKMREDMVAFTEHGRRAATKFRDQMDGAMGGTSADAMKALEKQLTEVSRAIKASSAAARADIERFAADVAGRRPR